MNDKRNISKVPAPQIPIPDLPSSSGAWFGTRTYIIEKDAEFVEAHTRFLEARSAQSTALLSLLSARMRLARVMVELAALPEICCREQEYRLRMLALTNEAQATEAAIVLAEARGRLAQALGGVKPAADIGRDALTVDDVESILAQFPELDGNISKISLLLRALVREKSG
ncbi:hypothetical protein [uncultured Hyphomicrobium sp.]|uniref:hypothetical protein n=1 Tax=uncultured Hyphomicrobium sp. TaxID=194373 RepID=UPI0025D5D131|nr:hypothetical protein [uncultured Hyphomicrobium sp.]